ncbi:hypothetical protein [Flavobacterium sp. UMI-01]|uniref:hypothetical protein n=1 Tax=Flavobacterium sp. UMI-01 TaxID=1441053 RepID=UPI001C7D9E59|nr:hypothetical protein [Flavobacterium sp. UMI-01]GIZ08376.1 hypothetical protein FUMI01_11030 [Flavobacterium sp. UMI-01]
MNKNQYKGITFCETWKEGNKTFEQFKAEFEDVWVFKVLQPKERLVELKKAFQIAISNPKKATDTKAKESKPVSK